MTLSKKQLDIIDKHLMCNNINSIKNFLNTIEHYQQINASNELLYKHFIIDWDIYQKNTSLLYKTFKRIFYNNF